MLRVPRSPSTGSGQAHVRIFRGPRPTALPLAAWKELYSHVNHGPDREFGLRLSLALGPPYGLRQPVTASW